MTNFIYTGVGARNTPDNVLELMSRIGSKLAANWVLRSGHAEGADQAFEMGAANHNGKAEIYIPWKGFNSAPNSPVFHVPSGAVADEAMNIASQFHPAWEKCSIGSRKLHTRNVFQVLGDNLDEPAHMLICWTKDGKGLGGTGMAINIAKEFNVPVFDLALEDHRENLPLFITLLEDCHD